MDSKELQEQINELCVKSDKAMRYFEQLRVNLLELNEEIADLRQRLDAQAEHGRSKSSEK